MKLTVKQNFMKFNQRDTVLFGPRCFFKSKRCLLSINILLQIFIFILLINFTCKHSHLCVFSSVFMYTIEKTTFYIYILILWVSSKLEAQRFYFLYCNSFGKLWEWYWLMLTNFTLYFLTFKWCRSIYDQYGGNTYI